EAALADMRYDYITALREQAVVKPQATAEQQRSLKIDQVLTHKYFAIPIFLGVMLLVFWLTFSVIGGRLSDWMGVGIEQLTGAVSGALQSAHVSPVLQSLIVDGIFAGVGSVLSFLPI